MSFPKRRPPCPSCEGVNQSTHSGGWCNDGTLPYTYVVCNDCNYHGMQITVWLPPEASTTGLDGERRAQMRQYARRRRGRLPQVRKLQNHRGRRLTDDRVEVHVRIIPGKVQRGLAKRLPGLKRKKAPLRVAEDAA